MEKNLYNSTLTERALQWVVDNVHPEATVVSVKQLHGGISSLIHEITLQVNGVDRAVVLRQIEDAEWLRSEPDLAVHEAESLRRAAGAAGVQTPGILAFDAEGSQCGTPAVLMTRLEGEVVLEPADVSRWLDGMAAALSQIHTIEPDDFGWKFMPYCDASTLDTSAWSKVPEQWRAAADIVAGIRPSAADRFIHRDYHPANIIWRRGEVSGVVDWVNGCVGPAGIDVGHCRVNLALLHGVDVADEFLWSYHNRAAEAFSYDPYWDLVTLIDFAHGPPPEVYGGWTALGVTRLTNELIKERLDSYLLSLLERFR